VRSYVSLSSSAIWLLSSNTDEIYIYIVVGHATICGWCREESITKMGPFLQLIRVTPVGARVSSTFSNAPGISVYSSGSYPRSLKDR
jgi:hypothetical protein